MNYPEKKNILRLHACLIAIKNYLNLHVKNQKLSEMQQSRLKLTSFYKAINLTLMKQQLKSLKKPGHMLKKAYKKF